MREILFRGQRLNGTERIHGDFSLIEGKTYIFDRDKNAPLNSPDWYEVKPETVGQYTGMNDKHGNKIIEGDICRFYNNKIGVVEMHEYHWVLKSGGDWFTFRTATHTFEIIGNIYENPDLLTPNEKI